jgi:hypothetical protein
LGSGPEETQRVLGEYAADARAIERQLIQVAFYMRGGCPMDQADRLTHGRRKMILEFVEDNIEKTNKTGIMMH